MKIIALAAFLALVGCTDATPEVSLLRELPEVSTDAYNTVLDGETTLSGSCLNNFSVLISTDQEHWEDMGVCQNRNFSFSVPPSLLENEPQFIYIKQQIGKLDTPVKEVVMTYEVTPPPVTSTPPPTNTQPANISVVYIDHSPLISGATSYTKMKIYLQSDINLNIRFSVAIPPTTCLSVSYSTPQHVADHIVLMEPVIPSASGERFHLCIIQETDSGWDYSSPQAIQLYTY